MFTKQRESLLQIAPLLQLPPNHLSEQQHASIAEAVRRVLDTACPAGKMGETLQDLSAAAAREHGPAWNSLMARLLREVLRQDGSATGGVMAAFPTAGDRSRTMVSRVGRALLRTPVHGWYQSFVARLPPQVVPSKLSYVRWKDREAQIAGPPVQRLARLTHLPVLSLLMATANPVERWLRDAFASVAAQSYPHWRLSICVNPPADPWLKKLLDGACLRDNRIRWFAPPEPLGISGALNQAAVESGGDYVGFLDHDDMLPADSLLSVAEALQSNDVDVLYTDEEFVNPSGESVRPHFKPDWSPRLLDGCMYIGHLVLIRRRLFDHIGGFRAEFDGAQDYDLVLRATEKTPRICHVPRICYQWRMHHGSVSASATSKPYTHVRGKQALEAALRRRKWDDVSVSTGSTPNLFLLRRKNRQNGATAAQEPVKRRSRRLRRYGLGSATTGLRTMGVALLNRALASGEQLGDEEALLLVRQGLIPNNEDWLDLLMTQVHRPGTAVVSSQILRRDGAIHHAGYVLGMGNGLGHVGRGTIGSSHWLWLDAAREVSAVSDHCVVIHRRVWEELGGFDPQWTGALRMVDFCFRAAERGYASVVEAASSMVLEDAEAGEDFLPSDLGRFVCRWNERFSRQDPYFSPNLRVDCEEIRLT